jgi:DNA (cytosine-5)-methyltransferase 1
MNTSFEMERMRKAPTYIDLFAGCGGLSLGLEAAGFQLELAVEKSPMAAETFYHNFINRVPSKEFWQQYTSETTTVETQAKSKLIVNELQSLLDSPELIHQLKAKKLDLVAGGPPCQGFSLAGRRDPHDVRNQLPWQFIELVERIEPKMVLIENVSGITQNFNKFGTKSPFEQLKLALEQTEPGYVVQSLFVNAMHFGAPQHRPRVMLIGLRSDIANNLKIEPSDSWRSDYDEPDKFLMKVRPRLAPQATNFGENTFTVGDAIWDLNDTGYSIELNDKQYNLPNGRYAKRLRLDTTWMPKNIKKVNRKPGLENHVLRKHAERIKTRFRLYQYLQREGLSPKLLNIPANSDGSFDEKFAELRAYFNKCKIPAVAPDGTLLAISHQELLSLIIDLKTKKHSQRPLRWDKPSPTIVSLPEDFVHPCRPRTMTVREMARFQSFPDSFEFRAKETTGSLRRRFEVPQYTQVGNAVPPLLAKAVGLHIHGVLKQHFETLRCSDTT